MNKEIKAIINKFGLKPHPEGGFFLEFYRAEDKISKSQLDNRYSGDRNIVTFIYFLITRQSVSVLHKIGSDEIWQFIAGSPAVMHEFSDSYKKINLGNNISTPEVPVHIVKANTDIAVETLGDYSFFTCVVAPGFDFDDFMFSDVNVLKDKFPNQLRIIEKLS